MARTALTAAQVEERLAKTPGWEVKNGRLHRAFRFPDFVAAFGWMASVALVAERMDHHPDWTNVYNRVDVELTTHDAGGLTDNDFTLAEAMTRLAAPLEKR